MSRPYLILGIPPESDERDIKRAYAKLIRVHRPDSDPSGFRRIHDAYQAALALCSAKARISLEQPAPSGEQIAVLSTEESTARSPSASTIELAAAVSPQPAESPPASPAADQLARPDGAAVETDTVAPPPLIPPMPPAKARMSLPAGNADPPAIQSLIEVRRLADQIGQDSDASLRALEELLAWQGTTGMWVDEVVSKVMRQLRRDARTRLDRALLTAGGSLVPAFFAARAAELNAPQDAAKAVPLARAWQGRLSSTWVDQHPLTSLRLALAVALENRAIAMELIEHAQSLNERWYPKEFDELNRRLLLAAELDALPAGLRSAVLGMLAGKRTPLGYYQRQRLLMLLQQAPDQALLNHLKSQRPKALIGLGKVDLPTAVVRLMVALAAAVYAIAECVNDPVTIGILGWITVLSLRTILARGLNTFPVIMASYPTFCTSALLVWGVLDVLPYPVSAWVFLAPAIGVAVKYSTSCQDFLQRRWWPALVKQLDMRVGLLTVAISTCLVHARHEGWLSVPGPIPDVGIPLLLLLALGCSGAAIELGRPTGYLRFLTASASPAEPRPWRITGLIALPLLALYWLDLHLPGGAWKLCDLALVPATLACYQFMLHTWRARWHERHAIILSMIGVAALLLSAWMWWTAITSADWQDIDRDHQHSADNRAAQDSRSVELDALRYASLWNRGLHADVATLLQDEIHAEPYGSGRYTDRLIDRILTDARMPDGLVELCLEDLAAQRTELADSRIYLSGVSGSREVQECARHLLSDRQGSSRLYPFPISAWLPPPRAPARSSTMSAVAPTGSSTRAAGGER